MNTLKTLFAASTLAALSLTTMACGDDKETTDSCPVIDAAGSATPDAPPAAKTYRQVEQLARPAIAEALLLNNAYLAGYNGTAPKFTGVPPATLDAVVGEAKTVLKAVYLGTCLVNGAVGLTATTGLKPAGMTCAEVGPAVFEADGVTLKATAAAGAQAYADAVFGQFEPDVTRIDTAIASTYLSLCGGTNAPLLCGGRYLTDDVMDDTYNYLIAGAAITPTAPLQFRALVSDGVAYSKAGSTAGQLSTPDASNTQQGHPDPLAAFPYSAAPF